jgi:hypothetical protein
LSDVLHRIDTNANKFYFRQLFSHAIEVWHLLNAGRTPGCPKIDHNGPAFQSAQQKFLAI